MEIQQLKYFVKVVEEENVTRAAEKLHVAQPAVTQTIKRLEEDLEVELFQRRNRRLIINEAGKELYKCATSVLEQFENIPGKVQKAAKVEKETITINLLAGSKFVTDAIIKFREANPDINFKVSQSDQKHDIDIEISTSLDPAQEKGDLCFREEIFLAVPREWADEKNHNKLASYKERDFISLDSSKQFKWICDYFCRRCGIEPRIAYRSDNPQSVRDLISAGLGVGFWPKYSWGEVNEHNVKLVHIDDFPCSRYLNVRIIKGNKKEAVSQFMNFLKIECHKM